MAARLQEDLLELIRDLLRLQVAENFVEEVDDLRCFLTLHLAVRFGGLPLVEEILNAGLDVQEPTMIYLLCQVVHFFALHHFVVVDERLVNKAEAIAESWI